MTELEIIRVETAHRCPDCGHAHDHHHTNTAVRCSADWCECLATPRAVIETGEPYERTVYAA